MTAADFLTSPIWGAWEDIFLGGELKARPTPRVAAKAVEVAASKAVESAALKADLGQSLQVEGGQCEKGMGCSSSPSSQSSRSRLPIAAAEPRHHEEAQKLAAALVQDLLDLSGPDRDREILIRRSEVAEGIQQIQHVLQETERAIVNGQESILVHTTERECYASRLRFLLMWKTKATQYQYVMVLSQLTGSIPGYKTSCTSASKSRHVLPMPLLLQRVPVQGMLDTMLKINSQV